MDATLYDDTTCLLGEGPLWHPERGELLWFDILARRLHSRGESGSRSWVMDDLSTAAGWVDRDTLLMARRGALGRFDLAVGSFDPLVPFEDDNPLLRPNDGRADPFGGFWIGSMAIEMAKGAGSIWRYFQGDLRRIVAKVTIPNAICFHPDRSHALWADTEEGQVWRQPLGRDGWPEGDPTPFLDLSGEGLNPDGAVMDAEGNAWIALWGAGAVRAYDPDARQVAEVRVPARQSSCPAFGGPDLSTLYVTSAAAGLSQEVHAHEPGQGRTYALDLGAHIGVRGLPEHRVLL